MGCFDSVRPPCPNCKTKLDFQSKAGDCDLNEYDIEAVPIVTAIDLELHDTSTCENCGRTFKLLRMIKVDVVPMMVKEIFEE